MTRQKEVRSIATTFDKEKINFPYTDPSTGLTWSSVSSNEMDWETAKRYCEDLTEGGDSGWRLPTIDDLRTLIQNCSKTETSGSCALSDPDNLSKDGDWSAETCASCDDDLSGGHSKFGDTNWFWSSSAIADYTGYAWFVYFKSGSVQYSVQSDGRYVRCVK